MFNRLACAIVAFSFISVALLFSGVNLHFSFNSKEIPTPVFYSMDQMEVRQGVSDLQFSMQTPIMKGSVAEKMTVDPKQVKCLQENIYFESRDQSIVGQVLVGMVTVSRLDKDHYPDTICGVVFQRKQFSWANKGRVKPNLNNPVEKRAWDIAGKIAHFMFENGLDKFAVGMTHYHTTAIKPYWSKSAKLTPVLTVGDHVFYSEET